MIYTDLGIHKAMLHKTQFIFLNDFTTYAINKSLNTIKYKNSIGYFILSKTHLKVFFFLTVFIIKKSILSYGYYFLKFK